MPAVQRNYHLGAKSLGECDHGGVGPPEREICVAVDQIGDARPVVRRRRLYVETFQATQKGALSARAQSEANQVRSFCHDERWDYQLQVRAL